MSQQMETPQMLKIGVPAPGMVLFVWITPIAIAYMH
ncbi:hypothetical protein AFERRI_400455 [Acidithiobacillus ferrivorans]|uniref:Uncharacterized protein n=1 Tax=Acidithiobacillus ferrivorans TaxID=160808 RepID=A0A060UVT1_9PROT|nr:hypothetical protein AFERRI_400455 [Acidithiobacillus ferrivorans]